MWDSYTLGIRCPTDGSPCAALAKEPVNDEEQVICQKTSWKQIFITFVLVDGEERVVMISDNIFSYILI